MSMADVSTAIAQVEPAVVIVDEQDGDPRARELLAELARTRPEIVRVLLAVATGGDLAGTTVLPKPVEPGVVHAVCAIALDCVHARRSARDLEAENNRLRGGNVEASPSFE